MRGKVVTLTTLAPAVMLLDSVYIKLLLFSIISATTTIITIIMYHITRSPPSHSIFRFFFIYLLLCSLRLSMHYFKLGFGCFAVLSWNGYPVIHFESSLYNPMSILFQISHTGTQTAAG